MKNRFDAAGELTPEAYANMYGDHTEAEAPAVLQAIADYHVDHQRPPMSFVAIVCQVKKRTGQLLSSRGAWECCMRLRDFFGLVDWDPKAVDVRRKTIRLTPAGMDHAGLRLEGRPLRYVRAALYQASAAE